MTETTYDLPAYRVSFTLAYGGRRYARLGVLPEATDGLPVLTDVLAHLLYDDYNVHTEVRGDGYSATASVVVRGRTAANYTHALACEARIPVSYQKLGEVAG